MRFFFVAFFFKNLSLSMAAVFMITLLLIPKISAALFVLICVLLTMIDVLGFMHYAGLTIDSVTVTYVVIGIGLSVDYSAHIGEAFMLARHGSKKDRAKTALKRMGVSVFNGFFSTLLAVFAMAFAGTYIFRVFFIQFFTITMFGAC